MKIVLIIKSIFSLIRDNYHSYLLISNKLSLIKSLQSKGVSIADDVIICDPSSFSIDLTRPSLIEIGHGTSMNRNFTILTHDFATRIFLHKYKEFIPSSGRVKIGNYVWFGQNVTVLKGSEIGDHCIVGLGSVVMGKIPANSVIAGCPARVICSLDEYFEKRKQKSIHEALDYARSINERFHRRPIPSDFWEEFPLFVSGGEIDRYPEIPIREQLGGAYADWAHTHKACYGSFDDFLRAAGIE